MKIKKAQASVEFLFTYGWAIMAITIVIGALVYFNVLNPDRYLNQFCDIGAQFDCVQFAVFENGSIILYLRNNHRVDVQIHNISYSSTYLTGVAEIDQTIPRGNVSQVHINNTIPNVLMRGDVQRIKLELGYSRTQANANIYTTSGNILTQVIN